MGRVAAHAEQGCISVGLVCVEAECRRAESSGEWLLPLSPMGPLPDAGQRSSVCQPSRIEGSRSFAEFRRGAVSSFLSLKGLSGLFSLTEGRDLGPGFFEELGLLSTLTYPKMQGAAHWKGGQPGSVGRPKLRPSPTVSLEVFSARRFLTSLFFNLLPMFTLLFFFLPLASLSLSPRGTCMS